MGREYPLEKDWQPIPASLPEKSHGQGSLRGIVHGVAKELDTISDQMTAIRRSFSLSPSDQQNKEQKWSYSAGRDN